MLAPILSVTLAQAPSHKVDIGTCDILTVMKGSSEFINRIHLIREFILFLLIRGLIHLIRGFIFLIRALTLFHLNNIHA